MANDPWAQFADAPDTAAALAPGTDDPWSQFTDSPGDQPIPQQASADAKPQGWLEGLKWEIQNPGQSLSPKNVMSAAVRPAVKAIAGVPGIFADAAAAGYNLLRPQTLSDQISPGSGNMQMPSEALNNLLDRYTTKPTGLGKGAELVSSTLISSQIPTPQFGRKAPEGFTKPQSIREQTFSDSRNAGYVAPPSSVKPTVGGRVAESIGGKIAMEQDASIKNQDVTNRLVRKTLGLGTDEPLTAEALAKVRGEASKVYETIRKVGTVNADEQFIRDLDAVTAKFKGANKDFPGLAKNDIEDIVNIVKKDSFESDSAVDAISILRDKSSTAYAQGDKGMGKAYKSVSNALEGAIERTLQRQGPESRESLQAFKDARQLIAKSYSVEKALNPSTGNVSAQKLGQQLSRGKYLSGELQTAGKFGQAFPKAAREVVDSGSVRNTDVIVGGVTAGLGNQPWYLAYPFARMGMRNYLLSNGFQNGLLKPPGTGVPSGYLTGAVPGMNAGVNALREEFSR